MGNQADFLVGEKRIFPHDETKIAAHAGGIGVASRRIVYPRLLLALPPNSPTRHRRAELGRLIFENSFRQAESFS